MIRLRCEEGESTELAQAEFNEIDQVIKIDGAEEPGYIDMTFRSHGKLHLSRRVRAALGLPVSGRTSLTDFHHNRLNSLCKLSFHRLGRAR